MHGDALLKIGQEFKTMCNLSIAVFYELCKWRKWTLLHLTDLSIHSLNSERDENAFKSLKSFLIQRMECEMLGWLWTFAKWLVSTAEPAITSTRSFRNAFNNWSSSSWANRAHLSGQTINSYESLQAPLLIPATRPPHDLKARSLAICKKP